MRILLVYQQDLEYADWKGGKIPIHQNGVFRVHDIKPHLMVELDFGGGGGYTFIVMTRKSTLTWIGSTS